MGSKRFGVQMVALFQGDEMKTNRDEYAQHGQGSSDAYQWKPTVLGMHYMDHVQNSVKRDPLLITKTYQPVSTWWIVLAIVIVVVAVFGDVVF